MATFTYAHDYDDHFPWGSDVVDRHAEPSIYTEKIKTMLPLPSVMMPYLKSNNVWQCPDDLGYDYPYLSDTYIPAHPSSFAAYGMSYMYRTLLVLEDKTLSTLAGRSFMPDTRDKDFGPADLYLSWDSSQYWHGTIDAGRSNVLFADGHAKSLNSTELTEAFKLQVR